MSNNQKFLKNGSGTKHVAFLEVSDLDSSLFFLFSKKLLTIPYRLSDLSSQIMDPTCISCIGKQSLNHWTIGEVPRFKVLWLQMSLLPQKPSISQDSEDGNNHVGNSWKSHYRALTLIHSTDPKDHLSSWHPLDPPSGGALNYVLNVISILPKVSKLQGTLTDSQIVTSWKIHLLASILSGWGWRGRKRIPNLLLAKSPEYIC